MRLRLLCLALALWAPPALADEFADPWWAGELSASAGFDWSSGDYDEPGPDTDILYLPFTVSYRLDDFRLSPYPLDQLSLRVTIPYIEVESPLAFFAEAPARDRPGASGKRRERGLGDVIVATTYTWFPPDEVWPVLELTGKLKVPTADEDQNLGTGAVDAFAQLDAFRRFGRATGFGTFGYRFAGNPPGGSLRDSPYASGGLSFELHRRVSAGAYYNWSGSASRFRHDAHEIVGFASYRFADRFSLEPYGVWGVAGYAPDYAVGLTLRVRLGVGRNDSR